MDSVKRELKSRMDKLDASMYKGQDGARTRLFELDARMDKLDAKMDKLVSNQERVLDILSANTAATQPTPEESAKDNDKDDEDDARSGSQGNAHVLAADVGEAEARAGEVTLDSAT
jgi:hypothetical protein